MMISGHAFIITLLTILNLLLSAGSKASLGSEHMDVSIAGMLGYSAMLRAPRQAGVPAVAASSQDNSSSQASPTIYYSGCLSVLAPSCSHYCEDVILSSRNITAACRCYEGYVLSNKLSCISLDARTNCAMNNGGCSEQCTAGACQCPPGFSLAVGGYCNDIDECARSSTACPTNARCVNLRGNFTCASNDLLAPSSASLVPGVYNEQVLLNSALLLGLAIWLGVLLIAVVALLITYCCLPPVMPSPVFLTYMSEQK